MTTSLSKLSQFGVLAVLCFELAGCATSGHTELSSKEAHVPISFSRSVRDEKGDIVKLDDLQTVGRFKSTLVSWSIFYNLVGLSSKKDLSEEINSYVGKTGGEALINTSITNGTCFFASVPVLSILPFWPSCSIMTVNADVVSRKSVAEKGMKK